MCHLENNSVFPFILLLIFPLISMLFYLLKDMELEYIFEICMPKNALTFCLNLINNFLSHRSIKLKSKLQGMFGVVQIKSLIKL